MRPALGTRTLLTAADASCKDCSLNPLCAYDWCCCRIESDCLQVMNFAESHQAGISESDQLSSRQQSTQGDVKSLTTAVDQAKARHAAVLVAIQKRQSSICALGFRLSN